MANEVLIKREPKLRIARKPKAFLPQPPNSFEEGRPFFCTDTQELFIGTGLTTPMLPVLSGSDTFSGIEVSLNAGMNINAYSAIAVHTDGSAYIADAATLSDIDKIVGVAITSATTGNAVTVRLEGEVDNAGFSFTPGSTVWLGMSGALTQTVPSGAEFSLPVGVAASSSRLFLDIGMPIILA